MDLQDLKSQTIKQKLEIDDVFKSLYKIATTLQ